MLLKLVFLQRFKNLIPPNLEQAESLEQLRWLENCYSIKVELTTKDSYSVDTPEDLNFVNQLLVN